MDLTPYAENLRRELVVAGAAGGERLLEHGVLVAPGSYLGAAGEGYVRVALVPSEDECRRAVQILEDAL